MKLDPVALAEQAIAFEFGNFLRATLLAHRATPLGMGYGKTRFVSPDDRFKSSPRRCGIAASRPKRHPGEREASPARPNGRRPEAARTAGSRSGRAAERPARCLSRCRQRGLQGETARMPWEARLVDRQDKVRGLYLAQAQLLQRSPDPQDRALGDKVAAFVRSMPRPDSQRLALARELRAAGT